MAPQENLLNSEDQFVISYEMLSLLQSLLQYEKQALQTILKRAYTKGKEITSTHTDIVKQAEFDEHVRYGVSDFFDFLELELQALTQEQAHEKIINSQLLKTLDHIDPMRFEQAMIHNSMKKTAQKINSYDEQPFKEQFLKELLKQWKPKEKNKKHALN